LGWFANVLQNMAVPSFKAKQQSDAEFYSFRQRARKKSGPEKEPNFQSASLWATHPSISIHCQSTV
jgi:hypothetical protein